VAWVRLGSAWLRNMADDPQPDPAFFMVASDLLDEVAATLVRVESRTAAGLAVEVNVKDVEPFGDMVARARDVVAFWDSLDAVPSDSDAPTESFKDEIDRRINALREALEAA